MYEKKLQEKQKNKKKFSIFAKFLVPKILQQIVLLE